MENVILKEIPESAASGRTAEIYEDIRRTLRTTQVNLIFRVLASHGKYFDAAWQALKPNAGIAYFERCADNLRQRMIPPMPPEVPDHREELEAIGYTGEQIEEIAGILEVYNYSNPKNLILVAALKGSLNGLRIGGVKPGSENDLKELPRGAPASMLTPRLMDPESAQGKAREVFERIRQDTRQEGVASVWRALGRYPEYLEMAWTFAREETRKKGFEITVSLSQGAAAAAAQEFPCRVGLDRGKARQLGCPESDLDLLDRTLDHFIHFIPRTNSTVLLLKAALLGEGKVRRKPFEGE